MKLLEGKVALITGGSRGIGEAIARKFAAQGAHIAFTYSSSKEKAEAIAAELEKEGIKARCYQSDAASFEASEKLVADVLQEFEKIDVLVNNAGITRDNLLLRMSEEQWDEVIRTNLKSVYNMTKNVCRPMMKQRAGSIINITSIVGITGNPGQANYAASKAGMIGFTKSIAQELGSRNIRCNALAPGFIQTDMTHTLDDSVQESFLKNIPLGRMGGSGEVADATLFLASDLSAYITGQVLSVDGGMNK